MNGKYRWVRRAVALLLVVIVGLGIYIRMHPLIYNESFWGHAHCIKIAGMQLHAYADQHNGKFPTHPGGYGDALLLLEESADFTYTGPGYDDQPFKAARRNGTSLPEESCGRVYIQGLGPRSGSEIAVLFDKLATPGDHCHALDRLFSSNGREVVMCDGTMRFIPESDWPAFAREQIELLVREGIRREEAERLYLLAGK